MRIKTEKNISTRRPPVGMKSSWSERQVGMKHSLWDIDRKRTKTLRHLWVTFWRGRFLWGGSLLSEALVSVSARWPHSPEVVPDLLPWRKESLLSWEHPGKTAEIAPHPQPEGERPNQSWPETPTPQLCSCCSIHCPGVFMSSASTVTSTLQKRAPNSALPGLQSWGRAKQESLLG